MWSLCPQEQRDSGKGGSITPLVHTGCWPLVPAVRVPWSWFFPRYPWSGPRDHFGSIGSVRETPFRNPNSAHPVINNQSIRCANTETLFIWHALLVRRYLTVDGLSNKVPIVKPIVWEVHQQRTCFIDPLINLLRDLWPVLYICKYVCIILY